MANLELHGLLDCPFAWRTRIAAAEKGVAADWIPYDADEPDPRVAHNPDRRSPLLYDGKRHLSLVESFVITQYIDEAYEGRALQPSEPAGRAAMRLAVTEIGAKLEVHSDPNAGRAPDRERVDAGLDALEKRLHDGRAFLGGEAPDLSDIQIWPFLTALTTGYGIDIAKHRPKLRAYLPRMKERPSFAKTRPPWAM